jgi:fumarate hydratase class II
MPGKVNPVIPEAVTMVAAQVIGNDATIVVAGQSGNFELNVMQPVIAYNLLQSIELLTRASDALLVKCVEGIKADRARCEEMIERSLAMITALVPKLGYDQAAAIAKEAYETGRTIREVVRERRLLDEEELNRALAAEGMTR